MRLPPLRDAPRFFTPDLPDRAQDARGSRAFFSSLPMRPSSRTPPGRSPRSMPSIRLLTGGLSVRILPEEPPPAERRAPGGPPRVCLVGDYGETLVSPPLPLVAPPRDCAISRVNQK